MAKFSDRYVKIGVMLLCFIWFVILVALPILFGNQFTLGYGAFHAIGIGLFLIICVGGIDKCFNTIFIDSTGVRSKVFNKTLKEYSWEDVADCGICARFVGSYWQYMVFFSDELITEAARYSRERARGKNPNCFITIPLNTNIIHAIYSYAPPTVISMFEKQCYPDCLNMFNKMLRLYRKEPRCLINNKEKEDKK